MTLALAILGGALALDQTSLGQFMLSRPLVSATLAGAILGDPTTGLVTGAFLEVLVLPAFPIGGARFPEGGPAGVVAGVAAIEGSGSGLGAGLAVGVALGAVWSFAGGWTISALRRLNERFAAPPDRGPLSAVRVVSGHLAALASDFLRGAALTVLGIVAARWAIPFATAAWPVGTTDTLLLLGVVVALSAGGLVRALDGWKRRRKALLGGLVTGAITGLLL